ncbi:uncharacterized protein LOC127878040 [Dreissena polymorpha]|uniref:Protein kinase domain-containing protein n=1 Tax=Dreissena polymorpha TaxID=45954 RepID=A0A9D4K398_DREPO|nr:uncharacterized protein LOC127878040 [Dreissena polymorpha]KAH3832203.1 hypothetical protein DPMN_105482 [Dreissena polymorpha]
MDEDEIDRISNMKMAITACRNQKVAYQEIKPQDVARLKLELKYQLHCKGKSRKQTESFLDAAKRYEQPRMEALADIYSKAMDFTHTLQLSSADNSAIADIFKHFPDTYADLSKERDNLLNNVARILVLGETGAGKTTFINLLLGDHFLPCSLLSNTHTICELHYCSTGHYRAVFHAADGTFEQIEASSEDGVAKDTLKKDLEKKIEDPKGYKKIQIFGPFEILKSGVVIVDSPGVGESEEMNAMVLDYVCTAAAFIYVIDITNAGGVQERMKALISHICRKVLDTMEEMPGVETTLFICNKWDEVQQRDKHEVLTDTTRKIQELWKGCQESQVIPFSTREAQLIQDRGCVSPKFSRVFDRLKELIPASQVMSTYKAMRFLQKYLEGGESIISTHLRYCRLNAEERKRKTEEANVRLNELLTNMETFFEDQITMLDKAVEDVSKELRIHLLDTKIKEHVCRFSVTELPKENTWEKAAVEVRIKVYEHLRETIAQWEATGKITEAVLEKIKGDINRSFPRFQAELDNLKRGLAGKPVKLGENISLDEEGTDILPQFVKNIFHKKFDRLVLYAPLLPFVFVTVVGRLPYVGIRRLQHTFHVYGMEKEFEKARGNTEALTSVAELYAAKVFTNITEKLGVHEIVQTDMQILYDLLNTQQQRMKAQIEVDKNFVNLLPEETKTVENVLKLCEPISAEFQIITYMVEHFCMLYFPSRNVLDPNAISVEETCICSGLFADIKTGTMAESVTGHRRTVCIRRPTQKVEPCEIRRYKKILAAYCDGDLINFAQLKGFWIPGPKECRVYQVFEPLKYSLREHLRSRRGDPDFIRNLHNHSLSLIRAVVRGLEYLHSRKELCVHFDLSLDSVAVDMRGEIKLNNICLVRPVHIRLQSNDGKLNVIKYVHLAPNLLDGKCISRCDADVGEFSLVSSASYGTREDMYSVGIIMWEMWRGEEFAGECGTIEVKNNQDQETGSNIQNLTEQLSDKLRSMAPKRADFFNDNVEPLLPGTWWTTMSNCLNMWKNLSAMSWLKDWHGVVDYPLVTIASKPSKDYQCEHL